MEDAEHNENALAAGASRSVGEHGSRLSDLEQPASLTEEQQRKLADAQAILGYTFTHQQLLLSAITHPSATEGRSVKYSYERLEFLGDSILGAIVSTIAFDRFTELDEGGLTRIKVALVSGSSLSSVAEKLGFADVIVFGSSETGTGKRGLHSALENVYEAVVAALYLDGGLDVAIDFVESTLVPRMSISMAREPENPKSALQEKLQEDGITPTYKLVETQGPPHDRTFVAQVFAGSQGLARGTGRTKKEAESQAAKSTLARLGEFFGLGMDKQAKAEKAEAAKLAKAEKAEAAKLAKAEKAAAKAEMKARKKSEQDRLWPLK
ncbi:ribonuclease III [Xiamenia xianingshaonis]|uniref:Ribonuclease 3 n=1 Tax=Xiamenia xianingshaonis TaxID=2682776 RepID=A0A9E6MS94_9ACTN|nr:ribonuclease III [Xiamenia xianingshaonis]NGM16614.1 ribonuclease III [Eggerthellaceae bacterium zg-893]NHM14557.1 ribonuclease III [Xiamenia xianingshaonis]NHM16126.1 ribonuclease III [Xiamenia xianingshaonis]QTU84994.1 ribonuclease III [Xiamenia xianingshaonis]